MFSTPDKSKRVKVMDLSFNSWFWRNGIGIVGKVYRTCGSRYILARRILPAQEAWVCWRSCLVFWSLDMWLLKLRDNNQEDRMISWIPKFVTMELGVHKKDVWEAMLFLVLWSRPIVSMLNFEYWFYTRRPYWIGPGCDRVEGVSWQGRSRIWWHCQHKSRFYVSCCQLQYPRWVGCHV